MHAITRRRNGVNQNPTAELSDSVTETGLQFIPGKSGDRSYADQRRTRQLRGRFVRFAVFVSLWALSVVPLARESTDGGESGNLVLAYLAVAAVSVGVAAVLRGVYVLLTTRRFFWSPWIFVIAAFLATAGYTVQTAGEEAVPLAGASAGESRA
jgi:hypothetical protein